MRMLIKQRVNVKLERGEKRINEHTELLMCVCVCQWFEEKQQHFENLDNQLRKLHASVESLVCHRKGRISFIQSLFVNI